MMSASTLTHGDHDDNHAQAPNTATALAAKAAVTQTRSAYGLSG